jgi:hypothetical protein
MMIIFDLLSFLEVLNEFAQVRPSGGPLTPPNLAPVRALWDLARDFALLEELMEGLDKVINKIELVVVHVSRHYER